MKRTLFPMRGYLDEAEATVAEMHYRVALETVCVKVVRNASAKCVGIAPEIADRHRLEKVPETPSSLSKSPRHFSELRIKNLELRMVVLVDFALRLVF